jgi:mono/diheme cytochrome c family protein
MLKIGYLLLFAALTSLPGCGGRNDNAHTSNAGFTVQPAATPNSNNSAPQELAIVSAGSDTYAENCAKCHGEHGEGTRKGIPLTSGHALHHDEGDMIEQVNNGTEKKMPGFKDKLTPEEISAVVNYVRGTLQAGAAHK